MKLLIQWLTDHFSKNQCNSRFWPKAPPLGHDHEVTVTQAGGCLLDNRRCQPRKSAHFAHILTCSCHTKVLVPFCVCSGTFSLCRKIISVIQLKLRQERNHPIRLSGPTYSEFGKRRLPQLSKVS